MTGAADLLATDVLVLGGGTAGFGAAVAAARAGCRVRLFEASARIGGVMSFCPGMPWGAAYPRDVLVGGLMGELAERLFAMTPPAAEKRPCTLENFGPEIVYDPDLATLTMFEMLEEAGVALHLETTALAPEMDGPRIAAVRYQDRCGAQRIAPQVVIDCTGDGEIAAQSGVPCAVGDGRGHMMGVTLSFLMVNADWDAVFAGADPYFRAEAARGIAGGRLHPDLAKLYLMRGFHPGTVFCNSVVIRDVDGRDPAQVARATQEGRRRCQQLAQFLRAEVPGFQNAWLTALGPRVGVRETRRLEGQHRITGAEIAAGVQYPDAVVCCDNPVDDVMRGSAEMTHDAAVSAGRHYTLPLRALIPKAVENLLFAGRLVSADPVAFAAVRGMPQCMLMGQAAGTAAALCLQQGGPVQEVPAGAVIAALQDQGVRGIGGQALVEA